MDLRHLTAATYNVHQWVGTDGRYDPFRGLSVLKEMNADIIGLQEVNFPKHIRHRITQETLARELDMRPVIGQTMLREHASYGNVLLTNLPIQAVRRHDITMDNHEPRGVLDVDLLGPAGLIRVLVTHFGLYARERRRQHALIVRILEQVTPREMTILMGDFNEWLPLRFLFRKIMTYFDQLAAPLSFPTFFPLLALDRMLIKPHDHLLHLHVHKSRLARKASDHYPVVAGLLPAGPGSTSSGLDDSS
jgi:endonuclease/exonuclease/phosphatase family metal-dependent hydrolase